MTIVFSIATHNLIVMTADSAIVTDFTPLNYKSEPQREYATGQKIFLFPGIGCLSTWGELTQNKIEDFLRKQDISPDSHSVIDLINFAYKYLTKEFSPHEFSLNDLGYHIAGFDTKKSPHLNHVFYELKSEAVYHNNDHSPSNGAVSFLYNGRNDLAHPVVGMLIEQIKSGKDTNFNLENPQDLVYIGDFVARFASEITPEVAPPFTTHIISPNNEVETIKNNTLSPIKREEIEKCLNKLLFKI